MDQQWAQAALLPLLLLFLGILIGGTPALGEASEAAVEKTDGNAATHLLRGSQTVPRNDSASTRLQLRGRGRGRGCQLTGNPIDDCWRCDPNWAENRKRLADCGIGFGRNALGGKDGGYYVVTDSSDNDVVTPKPGTLRHAVIQTEPLWIVFERDMVIELREELIMNSFKTIDGRGADVHIANGACLTLQFISNVIIHGVKVYNCRSAGNSMVRSSPTHFGWRTRSDGDGISIFGSRDIWVDHVYLANCQDGLIDAVMSSTAITISNNYFTNHDKVMLLGHSDEYSADKDMQVTVALNHFGEGLVQRMPRCRFGQFHVVNNDYTKWQMYAVGGSANPTIYSQGNRYLASDASTTKEVTKRDTNVDWESWDWWSSDDLLLNGAYFVQSGAKTAAEQRYSFSKSVGMPAKPAALVGIMTAQAGPLFCRARIPC